MISIGLNLILGLLLSCALVLGLRLERRLRGLRQSHTDFAKAVSELDQAAVRTETSLEALRAGTEEAKGELVSRIDQARIACQRLEKLSADAERLANQPLALSQALAPPPARPVERATPAPLPSPLVQAPLGASAFARPAPEAPRPATPIQTRPALAAASPRSRAKLIDDDLFDFDAPVPAPRAAVRVPPEPQVNAPRAPAVMAPAPRMADPEPPVEAPRTPDRFAREAFYRRMLERDALEREMIQDNFAPEVFAEEPEPAYSGPASRDPFESGRFANERRAMLAAVMGGRR